MQPEHVVTPPTNEPPERTPVRSTDWLAAMDNYLDYLKHREKKHRRDAEDAQLKADTVQHERMELENQLYKAGLRS